MAQLEDLSSTELLNFIICDTISATQTQNPKLFTNYGTISCSTSLESHSSLDNASTPIMLDHCHSIMKPPNQAEDASGRFNLGACSSTTSPMMMMNSCGMQRQSMRSSSTEEGGRKKTRRKRARVCKNREEAETQRMTHITIERNRRKQMNEHLAVLRSLMPDSYVQRGDQASIVEGAIEFVKELEHLLQSLEAQKLQQQGNGDEDMSNSKSKMLEAPFAQFFMYPQYSWSQTPNKYTSKSKGAIADIEVSLIETHASLRILSRRCLIRQLSKLVAAFHALHLSILHLTLTTMDPLFLYSISAKVEEGSELSSVDDIAAAVHHMFIVMEAEEATALC